MASCSVPSPISLSIIGSDIRVLTRRHSGWKRCVQVDVGAPDPSVLFFKKTLSIRTVFLSSGSSSSSGPQRQLTSSQRKPTSLSLASTTDRRDEPSGATHFLRGRVPLVLDPGVVRVAPIPPAPAKPGTGTNPPNPPVPGSRGNMEREPVQALWKMVLNGVWASKGEGPLDPFPDGGFCGLLV
jgi:hypothetical protein